MFTYTRNMGTRVVIHGIACQTSPQFSHSSPPSPSRPETPLDVLKRRMQEKRKAKF